MKINMFKAYSAYINDNPNHYWFKRKIYGWGWTPVTTEGWIITVIFLLFLVWDAHYLVTKKIITNSDAYFFVITIVLATLILILICFKTGEKPQWKWGI